MQMTSRFSRRMPASGLPLAFFVVLFVTFFITMAAMAQTPARSKNQSSKGLPRTADGHPDLQGVWTNATLTPLERPAELAAKATLTEQEAAAYQKQLLDSGNRD